MIEEILHKIGFSEKEAIVYITVQEQGKIAPADIARATGINRTTVYAVAKELLKKGVIAEDKAGSAGYLTALPPEELQTVLQKEERALRKKQELTKRAVSEIANMATVSARYSVPKIVFIDEDELEDYLYKRTPLWNESIMKYDGVWWGFQDHAFAEMYEGWIDWLWTEAPDSMQVKLWSNKSPIEAKFETKGLDRRHIRVWNADQRFTANTWVNGDYVINIITQQRPYYLVEMHDAVLAQNMRNLFQQLWLQE